MTLGSWDEVMGARGLPAARTPPEPATGSPMYWGRGAGQDAQMRRSFRTA